jgi:hydroxymethylpyrimidine/phosphomethylpyrimidine kinase
VSLYVGGAVVQADLETLQRLGAAGALLSVLSIVTEAT